MRFLNLFLKLFLIIGVSIWLAACGGDSEGGTGRLSVSIADAPIHDAQSVTVNFLGVEVKAADGPALLFNFCKDPDNPRRSRTFAQRLCTSLSCRWQIAHDMVRLGRPVPTAGPEKIGDRRV